MPTTKTTATCGRGFKPLPLLQRSKAMAMKRLYRLAQKLRKYGVEVEVNQWDRLITIGSESFGSTRAAADYLNSRLRAEQERVNRYARS